MPLNNMLKRQTAPKASEQPLSLANWHVASLIAASQCLWPQWYFMLLDSIPYCPVWPRLHTAQSGQEIPYCPVWPRLHTAQSGQDYLTQR